MSWLRLRGAHQRTRRGKSRSNGNAILGQRGGSLGKRTMRIEPLETRRLLTINSPIELADVASGNGTDGSAFIGPAQNSSVTDVSSVGDLNGDGFDDWSVGSPQADPAGNSSGSSYIIFGDANGYDATVNLGTLNGSNGFTINGTEATDLVGQQNGGGDINGDGLSDLIVSMSGTGTDNAGNVMVIYGSTSNYPSVIDINWVDGANGFLIQGEAEDDFAGFSATTAGDVNGDGLQDIVLGAYLASPEQTLDAGKAYVLFGQSNNTDPVVFLSLLNGQNGFKMNGQNDLDYIGFRVGAAGDINGDGYDDVLIGAPFIDTNGQSSGAVFVVYGKPGVFDIDVSLANLDGTDGFIMEGDATDDEFGRTLGGVGDFNGDGLDDFAVGAAGASDLGFIENGHAYLVYGNTSFPASMVADDIEASYGELLRGIEDVDRVGSSVGSAGDLNGDGYDDLIFGATRADGTNNQSFSSGESFVIWGTPDFPATGLN